MHIVNGRVRNRIIRSRLDALGYVSKIERIHEKHFELIINFEIIKVYKKRESANIYLKKLLKSNS